ncbi:MAG: glycosyltransferase [Christiangramia sp.]|uniref:glycosyltransferase n=1 Tax=Christiangramia sp. TaxID=1931228 RepID=UPI0032422B0D
MRSVFIAFTLKNSSVSEFFVSLANYLSRTHQVILITHANEEHSFKLNRTIKVFQWPTKRPKTLKDLFFLLKLIRHYKPRTIIGNFAAVNLFMIGGYMMGVKNRIAWYHTLTTQLEENKILKIRKRFFYKLATKVVANSVAGELDLQENFGLPASKIEVVNNAVIDPEIKGEINFNNIVLQVDYIK